MSIQKFRDSSEGIVAKFIVGLIIIVFALFGFGSITTFLAPVPKVAEVNGDDITQQEMELAVERNRRIILAQNTPPEDIDEDSLRRDVLQSLITRKLLVQEADALGLQYSDRKLDEEIVATPVFQIDGVFNPQQFQLVISSAGFTATAYREEMRRDKEFQQMMSAIRSTAFLTDSEVRRASSLAQQVRDIAWLKIDVDKLMSGITVDDDEIQAYYDENRREFVTEETVDLDYIELRRSDLLDEVDFTEAELQAFYEDTKDLYATPETRRVAHILIETNDEVTGEEAKEKIDAIYERIMNGEDFGQLAKEFSEDPGSAENGGDLGYNEPGTFVEEFEKTASELALNQVSKPVLTEFGYHIIKLLGVEEARTASLDEIRDRLERDFRSSLAEEIFVERSSRLEELAFEAQDLVEPAEELGLEVKSTGPVGRDTKEGIAANPAVMEAAFSADVLLDGNNSSVIEIGPNDQVVIHVREHHPSEIRPLDLVRDDIRETLRHRKAAELAEQQAREMVAMLESGSVARFVADQYGLEWQVLAEARRNDPVIDPEIKQAAFSLPRPGKNAKSVGLAILDDGGAAVISVTNVQNRDDASTEQELAGISLVLAAQQGAVDYQEFLDSLRQQADISKL